jgi:hypothetical protein
MAHLKNMMETTTINWLNGLGYSCFLGGSRRFGVNSLNSDIDIVVKVPGDDTDYFSFVQLIMQESGFEMIPPKMDDFISYDNSMCKVIHLGVLIDLIVIQDNEYYIREYKYHNKLQEIMNTRLPTPYGYSLRDYYFQLKDRGMKGGTIYQILITMMMGMEALQMRNHTTKR